MSITSTDPSTAQHAGAAAEIDAVVRPLIAGPLPVHLTAWDGSAAGPVHAPHVHVNHQRALRRLLRHPGELGAAQAYVTGEIDLIDEATGGSAGAGALGDALDHVRGVLSAREVRGVHPGPADMVRLARMARRLGAIGLPPPPPATQVSLRGRLHSRDRDAAAIRHHYDIRPGFYALFLDLTMAYSCAYFHRDAPGTGPGEGSADGYGLAEAQRDKLDLVCRKLSLRPGMRMLDVGCGWGSLALHAAEHYEVDVVAVTVAREQKQFLDARISERGLTGRIEARLQDYREVADGPFDAVASIEMGEHVGERNYARYAQALYDNGRPGARVLIQQMSRRGRHPGGGPFIEAFIAPDMTMRPVGRTVDLLECAGLEARDVQAMREHYVWTVDGWVDAFERRWDEAVAMMGRETARVWRLYLAGGRLAFARGRMGVDQVLAVRPATADETRTAPVRSGPPVTGAEEMPQRESESGRRT